MRAAGDGIGLLYDAAFGTIRWAPALHHLLDVFESDGCLIGWRDRARRHGGIIEMAGLDAGEAAAVAAGSSDFDLSRLDGADLPLVFQGTQPADPFPHRAVGVIHRQPGLLVVIDLLRRSSRPPFDAGDLADRAPLLEHLQRAWLIRAVLHRAGMSDGIDPCFVTDHVLGPDLCAASVDEAVDGAGAASKIAFLQPAPPQRAARDPHNSTTRVEREATVTAIPLFGQAAPELRLRLLYRLTPAESRIATSLARGRSLQAAADRLEISVATVRTHLSRIYDKTGTSRQSELVALLLRGPARLDQA